MLAWTIGAMLLCQPEPGWQKREVRLEDLEPPRRLGVRAEMLRQSGKVIPVLVLVPDLRSYARAIAGWTPTVRYPVLIDNGSARARLDIARFAHAFKPERTVRWSAGDPDPLPRPGKERRALIEAALAEAWDIAPGGAARIPQMWLEASPILAPGLVVTDDGDSAWPAALALAAGRAQPIAWVEAPGNPSGAFSPADADDLCARIEAAAEATGLPWTALGDCIDGLTLCLSCPAKIKSGDDEFLALTDRAGRNADGSRWAWAGQVFGASHIAAYNAMSALFLMPGRAMLFDGYPDEAPWNTYATAPASEVFQAFGMEVRSPSNIGGRGLADWRVLSWSPLEAGVLFVNTKGNREWFDLTPGRAQSGDVPFLAVPAFVHFVHSWSATQPSVESTIAGRWFSRGVYAYAGSVHEPFLQAFVPPGAVAARLASAWPWGAAIRHDDARVWKVACFGDPLITLGPAATRASDPLPLEGTAEMAATDAQPLAERWWTLAMLDDSPNVAREAKAMLVEDATRVDSSAADAAYWPAFAAGDAALVMALHRRLDEGARLEPGRLDLLWCALRMGAGAAHPAERDEMLAYLAANLRADQFAPDAIELCDLLERTGSGVLDPVGFLQGLAPSGAGDRRQIDAELKRRRRGR